MAAPSSSEERAVYPVDGVQPAVEAVRWSVRAHRRQTLVTVDGELDASTVGPLDNWVDPLARLGHHIRVDLTAARLCDRAGPDLFLRWQTLTASAGGSLRLISPAEGVRRLLAVAGLTAVSPAEAKRAPSSATVTPRTVPGPQCAEQTDD